MQQRKNSAAAPRLVEEAEAGNGLQEEAPEGSLDSPDIDCFAPFSSDATAASTLGGPTASVVWEPRQAVVIDGEGFEAEAGVVAGESFSGIPEETRVRLADGMEVDWPSSSRDPLEATRLAGQRPRVAMRRDRADRVPRWPRGDGRRLRSSGKFRREPLHAPCHVPQRERSRLTPTPAPPPPRGTNSRQRWEAATSE